MRIDRRMDTIITEGRKIANDAVKTTILLLKIMIPISIIIKILSEFGVIELIGHMLFPTMNIVGLPGEFSLVWATAMTTNIYGGLVVLSSLSPEQPYSIAQLTILGSMILIAHTLPIELRIAQKAGVKIWFSFVFRVVCAFLLGWCLFKLFTLFNIYQESTSIIWTSITPDMSLLTWIIGQIKTYMMIFFIILSLITLMRILKISGLIERLNNFLAPGLEYLGMSRGAAPVTIIGITLGLSYGGGLIINEARSGALTKKDIFLSLSFMGLSYSLIEDTLLALSMGAALTGIFFGRLFFTIFVMIILIWLINHLSPSKFEKYLIRKKPW